MKTKTWKAMVILNISQSLEQVTHTTSGRGDFFIVGHLEAQARKLSGIEKQRCMTNI
jgi:hypothetical protein